VESKKGDAKFNLSDKMVEIIDEINLMREERRIKSEWELKYKGEDGKF
jgi:hypothetical protein